MSRTKQNDNAIAIALPNTKNVINPIVLDSNGLSIDEQKFCFFYISNNFNATQAALNIGYDPSGARQNGCYLLKKARVQQHIKDLLEEEENKLGVNRCWKIATLKQCVEDGMNEKNYAAVIGAIKELNQMQGDYAPTKTINANFNVGLDSREIKEVDESIHKYKKEY